MRTLALYFSPWRKLLDAESRNRWGHGGQEPVMWDLSPAVQKCNHLGIFFNYKRTFI